MCNFGQALLSSPGLSRTPGMGRDGMRCYTPVVLVLAGREEGAWGHSRGSLPSHPGGAGLLGPLPELL